MDYRVFRLYKFLSKSLNSRVFAFVSTMKWLGILLLFMVACTLPQPITEDITKDVSDDSVSQETSNISVAVEKEESKVKDSEASSDTVVDVKKDETEYSASEISTKVESVESDDKESENKDLEDKEESVPAITGAVTGFNPRAREAYIGEPHVEETLNLTALNAMDYLISVFGKNVQSYQFINDIGHFYVRGDKIKIVLGKPERHLAKNDLGISSQEVITTIYLDRSKKSAFGYCEGKDTGLRRECEEKDILDVPREMVFYERNYKLPEDWLWEMIDERVIAVETDKYYVNSKKAIRLQFDKGSDSLEIFFDEKTGLPVKINMVKEGKKSVYDFLDLTANSVKEYDVLHRDLADIPSMEYYK